MIEIIVNGESRKVPSGLTLSEITSGEKPCGGHGKCGKCKVIARGELSLPSEAELRLLTEEELNRGVRLACTTRALGDCEVETLVSSADAQIVTGGASVGFEVKPAFEKYGIAIDIGTTTLAARLYDANGNIVAEISRLNPQSEFGADVISRIEASMKGSSGELAESILSALDEMIVRLASDAVIDQSEIDGVVITGNTVMLSLLTREDVEPFSHAPFEAKRLFGEAVSAKEMGLDSLAPDTQVYLPPCISAFVGADTVCALIATDLCSKDRAMLADIGTNGEMALWYEDSLTVCSTAAGPAFEGVGISMGMRGAVGAIDRVTFADGKLEAHVIGGGEAVGICGSGLVDAAAVMLEAEIIDETGALDDDPFPLKDSVSLSGKDVRMLQLAKSAICAGLQTLAEDSGLDTDDVPLLYIAGGFGNYLNKESAAMIGMLPRSLAECSVTVGNAALTGASMMLLNIDSRERATALSGIVKTLDLSKNKGFSEKFMMGMIFEET